MHQEIEQDKPGRCPKCGMTLVFKEKVDKSQLTPISIDKGLEKTSWKSYLPLIVIIGLILLSSMTISFNDYLFNSFALYKTLSYFMAGFFLTFSAFKLMDLKGFAKGYFTYDLLANKWFGYGYMYPFIELFFGLAMILLPQSKPLLFVELAIMVFSGIGVAIKIARHERFQCACLGTFLKVPLTKVTLIEDFGMAALASLMLVLK